LQKYDFPFFSNENEVKINTNFNALKGKVDKAYFIFKIQNIKELMI
jgi:hypothetical protein